MNISITRELQAMINQKVKSGLYNSASEVVREALRLFMERDELKAQRLTDLRRDVALGLEDVKNERVGELDAKAIKKAAQKRLAGKKKAA